MVQRAEGTSFGVATCQPSPSRGRPSPSQCRPFYTPNLSRWFVTARSFGTRRSNSSSHVQRARPVVWRPSTRCSRRKRWNMTGLISYYHRFARRFVSILPSEAVIGRVQSQHARDAGGAQPAVQHQSQAVPALGEYSRRAGRAVRQCHSWRGTNRSLQRHRQWLLARRARPRFGGCDTAGAPTRRSRRRWQRASRTPPANAEEEALIDEAIAASLHAGNGGGASCGHGNGNAVGATALIRVWSR